MAQRGELVGKSGRLSTPKTLALKSFCERLAYRVRQALTGQRGNFAGKPIGLFVFQA